MDGYMFEVAHGYEVLKGWVDANSKEEAAEKILNKKWTSIRETFEVDVFTEGYEIVDIW